MASHRFVAVVGARVLPEGWAPQVAVPRLLRRFRCTAREAAGLAELFLALGASPNIVALRGGSAPVGRGRGRRESRPPSRPP